MPTEFFIFSPILFHSCKQRKKVFRSRYFNYFSRFDRRNGGAGGQTSREPSDLNCILQKKMKIYFPPFGPNFGIRQSQTNIPLIQFPDILQVFYRLASHGAWENDFFSSIIFSWQNLLSVSLTITRFFQ